MVKQLMYEKFIACLGINPKPVRAAVERVYAPIDVWVEDIANRLYDFQRQMQKKEPIDLRIRKAFERFDGDANGHVDTLELKLALSALGLKVTMEQSQMILSKYDANGNGTLEIEEFSQLVSDFENALPVNVDTAELQGEQQGYIAQLRRMTLQSHDLEVKEVRRLSTFLETGVTGLTPRKEDPLAARKASQSNSAMNATQLFIDWLSGIGVTMKSSAASSHIKANLGGTGSPTPAAAAAAPPADNEA